MSFFFFNGYSFLKMKIDTVFKIFLFPILIIFQFILRNSKIDLTLHVEVTDKPSIAKELQFF